MLIQMIYFEVQLAIKDAYVLVVEEATKAWSLFQLRPLLKTIKKIELEGSTKLHKGQYKLFVAQPQPIGSFQATSSRLEA